MNSLIKTLLGKTIPSKSLTNLMKYLKKFENHTEYEENRQNLILPNVSLCKQENEVHYHEFEYIVYFDNYASSDVNIIDSDTQEVLYTIDSTHYGPFNMKKNKTYIARLVNGQTTQTQRPCDWSFSSDDIVNDSEHDYVFMYDANLYEYNIGYETLGIKTLHTWQDYYWLYDYEALLDNDKDYTLHDAINNNGINVVNQKFRDYAIDNNKANYIEFYNNNGLNARIKNTQTDEVVDVGVGHCEMGCEEENSILFAQTLPLSDYTMRSVDTDTKYLQMDIWSKL